jgi:hypothetical protein
MNLSDLTAAPGPESAAPSIAFPRAIDKLIRLGSDQ